MKSIRLYGVRDLRLEEGPEPTPASDEVRVKVTEVGICGSDIHWFNEANMGELDLSTPFILGHEFAGEILSGSRRGERVAIDPAIPCGTCRFCLQGAPNHCLQLRFAGDGITDGGLRERLTWPARCLIPLPDRLSSVEGAMLEPLGIALYAADLSRLTPGARVAVLGCGPIGLILIQLALRMGAIQVLATDRLAHRVKAALDFGASCACQVRGQERDQELWEATLGEGCDVVFEVSGDPAAIHTSMAVASRGGQVILVGIPVEDRTTFRASTARDKGLSLHEVRRSKNTTARAIRLVEQGMIDVKTLVTHQFSLSQYLEAFEHASRREGIKTIIKPG